MINVTCEVHATRWTIQKFLNEELPKRALWSFDTETAGIYSKAERAEAEEYLKGDDLEPYYKRAALQIANNSGLSYPSLIKTTHFIFGVSESHSVILICDNNYYLELLIWDAIADYDGLLLIHNVSFDLKIMQHRINRLPKNWKDTQLMAKCLTNNCEVYKSKVGLKDLMGSYYDPMWSLFNEYEPDNLKNPAFIKYCAIDGAATIKLWHDIQEILEPEDDESL